MKGVSGTLDAQLSAPTWLYAGGIGIMAGQILEASLPTAWLDAGV